MKTKMLAGSFAGCLLALGFAPAHAATYSAGLDFETTDQSMWSQGNAGILDIDRFIGPQWNPPPLVVGGIFEAEVPALTIIPEVCAWGVCTPAVTTPAVDFGDFGAQITGSTHGAIGFDVDLDLNTGSVDVAYPGTANFEYPDADELVPGVGTIGIGTTFDEGASKLATTFPFASLELDFVFDVYAAAEIKACLVNCGSYNLGVDIDKRLELIDISTDDAQVDLDFEYFTVRGELPDEDLDTVVSGTNGAGNLVTNGIDNDPLFDLDIDLDLIATTLLGIPALTQEVSLFGSSAGFTLLDVLVGAEVRVLQQFVFDPILMVKLAASDGQSVTGAVGSTLSFNTFSGGETLVTPTFFLDNKFTNITTLQIRPTFDLELLKAHFMLNLPDIANDLGISDVNLSFGPVFQTHLSTNFNVNVFDDSWQIPFDPIVGAAFVVKVPEPSTLTLLTMALAAFGAGALGQRRRRRPQGL